MMNKYINTWTIVMFVAVIIAVLIFMLGPQAKAQTVNPLPGVMDGKTIVVACGIVYDVDNLNATSGIMPMAASGIMPTAAVKNDLDPEFSVLPVCGGAVDIGRFLTLDGLMVFQNGDGFMKNASIGVSLKTGRNTVLRLTGGLKHFEGTINESVRNSRNYHAGASVGIGF